MDRSRVNEPNACRQTAACVTIDPERITCESPTAPARHCPRAPILSVKKNLTTCRLPLALGPFRHPGPSARVGPNGGGRRTLYDPVKDPKRRQGSDFSFWSTMDVYRWANGPIKRGLDSLDEAGRDLEIYHN